MADSGWLDFNSGYKIKTTDDWQAETDALRAQVASLQELVARKDEGLIKAIEIIDSEGVYTNAVTKLQTLLALKASDVKAPAPDVLVEALQNISNTNWHFTMSRKIARDALTAYEQGKV